MQRRSELQEAGFSSSSYNETQLIIYIGGIFFKNKNSQTLVLKENKNLMLLCFVLFVVFAITQHQLYPFHFYLYLFLFFF